MFRAIAIMSKDASASTESRHLRRAVYGNNFRYKEKAGRGEGEGASEKRIDQNTSIRLCARGTLRTLHNGENERGLVGGGRVREH